MYEVQYSSDSCQLRGEDVDAAGGAEPHSISFSCTWLLVFSGVQRPPGLHGHWMYPFLRQICTIEEPKYRYVCIIRGVPFRVASLQPPTVLQDWSCRRPPYWRLTSESAICDWNTNEVDRSMYVLFHVVAGHRLEVSADVPNTCLSRYRL